MASQNGFPSYTDYGNPALLSNQQSTVPGTNVQIQGGVRAGDAATILLEVARRFNRTVEPLVQSWGCWGFEPRTIRGSTAVSNHASGTAIDLNSAHHPLGDDPANSFSRAQLDAIHAIIGAMDGVVRWGGDYSGRKDGMHFELNCPPDDPRVARLAASIRGGSAPPAPAPSPPSGGALFAYPGHLLKSGDKGLDSIKRLQQALNLRGAHLVADGAFGPATLAAVKAFQSARGLAVDGLVGPATWGALSRTS